MNNRTRYKYLKRIVRTAGYGYGSLSVDSLGIPKNILLALAYEKHIIYDYRQKTISIEPSAISFVDNYRWRGYGFWVPLIFSAAALIVAIIALLVQLRQ